MKNYHAWILFLFTSILVLFFTPVKTEAQDERPNILLIVSDDQRYDTMQYMPRTTERIFDEGVTFENAYVTTSRCCPSRASIMTGMYAHTHNVRVNSDKLTKATIAQYLDDNGYFTGLVGKYLNSYPTKFDDSPLPEFDYWIGMISGPTKALYYDITLNVNGEKQEHEGYQTYILRDYALEFIRQAHAEDQPFFLMFTPYAPHLPAEPAPGDSTLFIDEELHRPPNFNSSDMSGKPQWLQSIDSLGESNITNVVDKNRLRQNQSLNALDESIDTILTELEEQNELDNTIVIYISDNGFFWGEHRIETGKIFVYEESIHVPFAIRYPPIAVPHIEDRLVGNIDIAPTILNLANIPISSDMDGRSLIPLMENNRDVNWREHILIEGWPLGIALYRYAPPYQAIHTGRYVYVETREDLSEFYDLKKDPYQLTNEIENPEYQSIISELQGKLALEQSSIFPAPPSSGATESKILQQKLLFQIWQFQIIQLFGPVRVWHLLYPSMIGLIIWILLRRRTRER